MIWSLISHNIFQLFQYLLTPLADYVANLKMKNHLVLTLEIDFFFTFGWKPIFLQWHKHLHWNCSAALNSAMYWASNSGRLTCSTSRLITGKPSSAELSQPLVKILSKPSEIRASNATAGSWTISNAEGHTERAFWETDTSENDLSAYSSRYYLTSVKCNR